MRYFLIIILLIVVASVYIIESDNNEKSPPPAVNNSEYVQYDRKLYKHWVDEDRDCQNTRQEVLIEESVEPVVLDERGCKVISGLWEDPFTGNTYTNPSDLDVDHMIPLKEAHVSGGYLWSPAEREQYANDMSNPDTLIAVSSSANRQKGAKDVAQWLPPNEAYRCEYVIRWMNLKETWGFSSDDNELKVLFAVLEACKEIPPGIQ